MSRTSRMLMAVTAAALTAGAAQLALGRDLGRDLGRNLMETGTVSTAVAAVTGGDVNRAAKSDRLPQADRGAGESRTVSARVGDLANTSVLIRLNGPARKPRSGPPKPAVSPASAANKTFACEPMVSVLTEIARQLAPGRCLS